MTELALSDLADQVLCANPHGTKDEWGEELLALAEAHEDEQIDEDVHRKTVAALGNVVSQLKARREAAKKRAEDKKTAKRYLDSGGRPITPTISVKTESGASQLMIWTEATPRQFMDAVLREQKVIDGRNDSNAIRLQVVQLIQDDERLQDLPTLKDVCDELGIDPDTLGLDELDEPDEVAS